LVCFSHGVSLRFGFFALLPAASTATPAARSEFQATDIKSISFRRARQPRFPIEKGSGIARVWWLRQSHFGTIPDLAICGTVPGRPGIVAWRCSTATSALPRAEVVSFARTSVPGEIYRRLPAWRSVQLPTKAASRRRRRLDVPRQRRQVRGRPRFVHLRFKISRFLQQSPGNLGVPGCFGEL